MGAEGREHAASYSWDRAARGIEGVLREAVTLTPSACQPASCFAAISDPLVALNRATTPRV